MTKYLVLAFLILTSVACKRVETKDGTVPPEYVSVAKNYEGTYQGNFEGMNGTLTISMDGNRPVAKFVSANGDTDIIGRSCRSSINNLVAITPQEKNNQIRVDSAEFAFNPGACNYIYGRVLFIDFKHNGMTPVRAEVSLTERYETRWREECYWDAQGRRFCRRVPETYQTYMTGKFSKVSL